MRKGCTEEACNSDGVPGLPEVITLGLNLEGLVEGSWLEKRDDEQFQREE